MSNKMFSSTWNDLILDDLEDYATALRQKAKKIIVNFKRAERGVGDKPAINSIARIL